MKFSQIIIILSFLILSSCGGKEEVSENIIQTDNIESEMIKAYNEGVEALEKGDVTYASKKFNEVEILFPQSEWAPRASLMSAYSYWTQQYYSNAIDELQRFIKLYSSNENLDYAYYLLAMCYYDSIIDEKKDLLQLVKSKKYFELIKNQYPNTDYALDARYKLELIQDLLAAKEIYIARHYIKKEKWIAAINRLKNILNNYDTTIYIEEALHRLVEVHYIIGLETEAKKYAKTLGYNYKTSQWYEQSYKVFDDKYELRKVKIQKDKRKKLIGRIKSFF
jgi:outer membrane protein assembly factor BamD|tara:strand:+ start:3417 stop:4253 length:837 start_codon:yes stop_codon:yes gene_type:complete